MKMKNLLMILLILSMSIFGQSQSIYGTLSYANGNSTLLNQVQINLMDGTTQIASTTTNNLGYYEFNNIPNGNYQLEPIHNIEWGGVNTLDAMFIRMCVVGLYELTPLQQIAGDVNEAGYLNMLSVINIRRRVVGLINTWNAPDFVIENTTINVNGNNVEYNFQTLCSGDVDGSYVPDATSSAIIADHTMTNVESIPLPVIVNIKNEIKYQWCGQSHSHQVPSGMKLLEGDISYLDVTVGDGTNGGSSSGGWLPEPNGTLCMMDGLQLFNNNCGNCCLSIYPHEYWNGSNHIANFQRTFVTCFPNINVSGFVWCGELESASEQYVISYLSTMEQHEIDYPDIQFVYSTGHAQGGGSYGYNRHLRNEQIRQYCINNNKVLFDFGDLDAWSNGDFSYYIYNNDTIPIQHDDYYGDTYHHTNALSCKNKAKATWGMFASMFQPEIYTISGVLTYANDQMTQMNDVEISLMDGTTVIGVSVTNEAGEFAFEAPNGTYTYLAITDKERGGTNISDVNILISYINGTPMEELSFMAGDVTYDGAINLNDINLLISEILGLTDKKKKPITIYEPSTISWNAPNYVFEEVIVEVNGSDVIKDFKTLCSGDPDGSFIPTIEIGNDDLTKELKSNKIENLYISNNSEVTIYDLSGRIVLKLNGDTNLKRELLTLKRGIYIYRCGNITTKIVR